jgi:hypothetical protein
LFEGNPAALQPVSYLMKRQLVLIGALGAVVAASACTDPIHITAQTPTLVDTLSVYALSGSAPSLPAGLDIFARQPVRVDGLGSLDIAFDIVSPTQVRILPVRFVVSSTSGVRLVGLARSPGTFAQLLNAPSGGYTSDSTMVLNIGELMVIQTPRAQGGEFCQLALNPYLYAKLAILSIDVQSRLISFELGFDPNCGFRSFQPGIPTS